MSDVTYEKVGGRYWIYFGKLLFGKIYKPEGEVWILEPFGFGGLTTAKQLRKVAKMIDSLNRGE